MELRKIAEDTLNHKVLFCSKHFMAILLVQGTFISNGFLTKKDVTWLVCQFVKGEDFYNFTLNIKAISGNLSKNIVLTPITSMS